MCVEHSGPMRPKAVNDIKVKRANMYNEVVKYKTVCSWSLLLLHNTVGGVLWAGETRARDALHLFSNNYFSLPLFLPPSLSHTPLGLRRQFRNHLQDLGLKDFDQYNSFSTSEPMIRAIITAGLQPNIVKMAKMLESGGSRGHGDSTRKRVRPGFKTL